MKSREVPNRNFPKYWLAMSDAVAFNLVQTALAFSSTLRTEIAEQARIAPALHAAEIAVLLLSAAEGAWGKGKADNIVKQIVGPAALDSASMSKVYLLVHRAMSLLPETAWAADRLNARRDLLNELRQKGYALQPALPAHSLKEEIAEQEWLRTVRETRKSDIPGK
ncbi:MAG: hypothetical protein V7642_1769 [Burkholderiales bacterium]|jgi:hypothetical protein